MITKPTKQVYKFDLKGNFLKSYSSKYEAGKQLNIPRATIYNAIYKRNIVRKKWYFSHNRHIDIKDMCLLNNPFLSQYQSNYINNKRFRYKVINNSNEILGHKKESYFTESEMLIGYVAPSYDELSKEEKSIFNKLK